MAIAGYGGGVYVGANKVAEIKEWSIDVGPDMLEATNFDSNGWKEFVAGLRGASGSFSGNWDVANDVNGQKALQDAALNGTTVTLKLMVDNTNYIQGTALVKQSIDVSVDDIASISFDFTFTGAVTAGP